MAEKITINVPHKLSQADARARIDSGFAKVQEQVVGKSVEVEQNWAPDQDVMTFKAGVMGQSITGTLNVMPEKVLIEIDLPWFLAKLAGPFREKLAKGTQLLLDKK